MKWRSRLRARAVGIKIEKEGDDYIIVRLAWWMPETFLKGIKERLESEMQIYGKPVKVEQAGKVVKITLV